ncbi:MAG: type II secretion system protein [Patescibacteria group bacterium]
MLKNKKGFTIIELLIVIAIIGLLATISIVALNGARQKGRDAKRVGDIRQIQTALELYFNDQNSYPLVAASTELGRGNAAKLCDTGFVATATACTRTYMGIVPTNPTPGGSEYTYTSIGTGTSTSYTLRFTLEDSTGAYPAGIHTASQDGIN